MKINLVTTFRQRRKKELQKYGIKLVTMYIRCSEKKEHVFKFKLTALKFNIIRLIIVLTLD